MAKLAIKKSGLDPIFREKFSLDVSFFWKDKRSQLDCDGALKMVQDCMNGIVFSSDKFCLPRVIDYGYDEKNPHVAMTISCPPSNLVEVCL